jgi:hypothetical protein
MKNAVFWDFAPCRSCVNRRSSETSVHTRSIWRHIPEDGILHVPGLSTWPSKYSGRKYYLRKKKRLKY